MSGIDLALYRLIQARGMQGFAWGSRDCFLWACDAVLATTGRDPGADLRGSYSTWQEARALLRRLGGLRALASARLGTLVQQPQDGDVALMPRRLCVGPLNEHGLFGVVWRSQIVVQSDESLVYLRLDAAEAFWRLAP